MRAGYGDKASQELDCIPSPSSGAYFPRALIASAERKDIPVLRYAQTDEFTYRPEEERAAATEEWIDEHLRPVIDAERDACESDQRRRNYLGFDIARSGDLSLIAVAAEAAERISVIGCIELRNMPFSEQQRVLHWIIYHLLRFCAASIDARGNGQMLAEEAAQEFGPARVNEVAFSRSTHAEWWPKYKARLEDGAYTLPRHDGIAQDHRSVVLNEGVPVIAAARTTEKDGTGKRHGDGAIANMLVVHAVENDSGRGYVPGEWDYVGIGAADVHADWLGDGADSAWDDDD